MLENKFKILCQNFSKDTELISLLWQEIRVAYYNPMRYYHTLKHLEHIYKELHSFRVNPLIEFAIFYHDIIYDATRDDNEDQSALLAKERLEELNVPSTFCGRKKVLEMFLDKEKIYGSKYFYDKYEERARENILMEYNSLHNFNLIFDCWYVGKQYPKFKRSADTDNWAIPKK